MPEIMSISPEIAPVVGDDEQLLAGMLAEHGQAQIEVNGMKMALDQYVALVDVLCPVPASERSVLANGHHLAAKLVENKVELSPLYSRFSAEVPQAENNIEKPKPPAPAKKPEKIETAKSDITTVKVLPTRPTRIADIISKPDQVQNRQTVEMVTAHPRAQLLKKVIQQEAVQRNVVLQVLETQLERSIPAGEVITPETTAPLVELPLQVIVESSALLEPRLEVAKPEPIKSLKLFLVEAPVVVSDAVKVVAPLTIENLVTAETSDAVEASIAQEAPATVDALVETTESSSLLPALEPDNDLLAALPMWEIYGAEKDGLVPQTELLNQIIDESGEASEAGEGIDVVTAIMAPNAQAAEATENGYLIEPLLMQDAVIERDPVEAQGSSTEMAVSQLVQSQEAIVTTNEEAQIVVASVTAKEFFAQVLPLVTEQIETLVTSIQPGEAIKVAAQIELLVVVADRLHELVVAEGDTGEEAVQIEAFLGQEYTQLLVILGIKPTTETINAFIRYIRTPAYQLNSKKFGQTIDTNDLGTHEIKRFDEHNVFAKTRMASVHWTHVIGNKIGQLALNQIAA